MDKRQLPVLRRRVFAGLAHHRLQAKDLREVLKVAKAAVMSRLQRECAALEGVLSQMWEGYTAGEGEMHAEVRCSQLDGSALLI